MSINDAGVIGGNLVVGYGYYSPYVWTSPSTGRALAMPDGMNGGRVWIVRGNYAVGNVVHYVSMGDSPVDRETFAEWNLHTGAVRVASKEMSGLLGAADPAGRYVVNAFDRPSYLVQPGRPDIELPAPPGLYPQIRGMSDDGRRLVGELVDTNGNPQGGPMSWTCS